MKKDLWEKFRLLTPARIALGRSGGSLPTKALLDFRLAHARARDAVHTKFDPEGFAQQVRQLGMEALVLVSGAKSREEYLQRPDLGRKISPTSKSELVQLNSSYDLVIVVSDGLSAFAIQENGMPYLSALHALLEPKRWKVSPVFIVGNGRVALQDEIGEVLKSKVAIILIGERPGLGSADSLGMYLVYEPKIGKTDADRNCISNIRHGGLSANVAAQRTLWLMEEAIKLRISGVALKDQTGNLPPRLSN